MTKVSAIIPCFQALPYLRETLDSALRQTRPPHEVIVCDDQSRDETWDYLQSQTHRIRVIRNPENRGPGFARNHGASVATGDYFAFLDADDVWMPHHLEQVAGQLDRFPQAGAGFSRVQYLGSREGITPPSVRGYPEPEDLFLDNMRGQITVHPSTLIVRREVFQKLGGFMDIVRYVRGKRIPSEDIDFSLRCSRAWPFVSVPGPTAFYRIHPHQLSQVSDAHLVLVAEYKVRLLRELRQAGDARYGEALLKTRLWWVEWLERIWSGRDMDNLRLLAGFGLRNPLLAGVTARYALRAALPAALTRKRTRAKTAA